MTKDTQQPNDSQASEQQHADDCERGAEDRARRAYARPKLTAYGNVREFTRGGGGTKADKGGFFKA